MTSNDEIALFLEVSQSFSEFMLPSLLGKVVEVTLLTRKIENIGIP